MKRAPPRPMGIVGGAGPLAGSFLFERIVRLCIEGHNRHRDADFPTIRLLSFPFSDMLSAAHDAAQIRSELSGCLRELRQSGSEILLIACNTAHVFLDPKDERSDLIHLPQEVGRALSPAEVPLVLCTSTSAKAKIHQRFFPCIYPDPPTQKAVDRIIGQILKGLAPSAFQELQQIIRDHTASAVILGCTELSLLYKELPASPKRILDPLEIAARLAVERSFANET